MKSDAEDGEDGKRKKRGVNTKAYKVYTGVYLMIYRINTGVYLMIYRINTGVYLMKLIVEILHFRIIVGFMVFNATFNNISVIS